MTDYASIIKHHASDDTKRLNPDYFADEGKAQAPSGTARVTYDTANGSQMERNFANMWQLLGGPVLHSEVRFHPERRWRLDFCHMATKTGIELEGGTYSQGRHTRGRGFANDCEKYNAAQRLGYTVFRLATGMIQPDHVQPIIDYINEADA